MYKTTPLLHMALIFTLLGLLSACSNDAPQTTQFRGPHTTIPTYLINMHPVQSVADAENYVARLHAASDYLDQTMEQMQLGAAIEVYLPDWSYPQMIVTARNTISGAPFDDGDDSAMWADIKTKIARLDISPEQAGTGHRLHDWQAEDCRDT